MIPGAARDRTENHYLSQINRLEAFHRPEIALIPPDSRHTRRRLYHHAIHDRDQRPQSAHPFRRIAGNANDIYLDRIVTDPEYRRAVHDPLRRRWGICEGTPTKT